MAARAKVLRKPLNFMESEGSLHCLQDPALLKKLNLNLKPEDHHNLKISDMTILKT
jgi:hypothetical protein